MKRNTSVENINSPIDILKPPCTDKIKEYEKELSLLQFRKDFSIDLCERYRHPEKNYSFIDINNKLFELHSVGDKVTLSLIGNFNITDGRKIVEPFNDGSKQEDNVYCSLDLVSYLKM